MRPRTFFVATASLVVLSSSAHALGVPDATAEYVSRREDAQPTRGKLYALKGRFRSESEVTGAKAALIVDTRSDKVWVLLPEPFGCIVQPIDDGMRANMPLLLSKDAKERFVASETIDGHPTKKYELTSIVSGTPTKHYVWRATDLKGFPLRISDESGRSVTTFDNVLLGKPAAKLFEPPANCKAPPTSGGGAQLVPR